MHRFACVAAALGAATALGPAAIQAGAQAPPEIETPPQPALFALLSVVRIRGTATATGARIELLSVRAPRGARIVLRCSGAGCPAAEQRTRSPGTTSFRRFQRELPAGVVIELAITSPGEVGKYTRLEVRRGRPPTRDDLCVASQAASPEPCPSPIPPPAETQVASLDGARAQNARGYELLRAGRFDAAIRAFVRAGGTSTRDSIQYSSALFGLARSLRLSGRVEDALTVIRRRVRLRPRTANSRLELAAARRAVRDRLRA